MRVHIFDGRSARLQEAELTVIDQEFSIILASGVKYKFTRNDVEISKLEDEILVSANGLDIHLSFSDCQRLGLGTIPLKKNYRILSHQLLIVFFVVTIIFFFHQPFIRWSINLIPDQLITKLSSKIAIHFKALHCMSSDQDKILKAFFLRLGWGAKSYQAYVVREASVNAFALPGRLIIIHEGLIDHVSSPEALAGVLAHELAHVELNHVKKLMMRDLFIKSFSSAQSYNFSSNVITYLASSISSQQDEREADLLAATILRERMISADGLKEIFTEKGSEYTVLNLFSTHPPNPERLLIFKTDYPVKPVLPDDQWRILKQGCVQRNQLGDR